MDGSGDVGAHLTCTAVRQGGQSTFTLYNSIQKDWSLSDHMENKACNKIFYFVSVFAPVIYMIFDKIQKFLQTSYSQNFKMPVYLFFLSILTPVIVSVLFFVKIFFQKKMVSNISKYLNILVTVLLIVGIVVFYKVFDFWFIVTTNSLLTFIICLQICSLVYDVFLNRN